MLFFVEMWWFNPKLIVNLLTFYLKRFLKELVLNLSA